jgi:hypothetical protein
MPLERVRGLDAEGVERVVTRSLPIALPPEPNLFPAVKRELTPEQRDAAIEAFAAAANEHGGDAPTLVARYAHRLAVSPDGYVLFIEFPRLPAHPSTYDELERRKRFWPADHLGIAGMRGCETFEDLHDLQWLDVDAQPMPFAEAIPLLLSDGNPEIEMARRRAEVTAKKQAAADRRRTEEEAERERARAEARWRSENARRLLAWGKLTPRQRELYWIAERLPAYRELLVALVEVEGIHGEPRAQMRTGLPEAFKPELKGAG